MPANAPSANIWSVLEDAEWLAHKIQDEIQQRPDYDAWLGRFARRASEARGEPLDLLDGKGGPELSTAASAERPHAETNHRPALDASPGFQKVAFDKNASETMKRDLIVALLANVSHEIRTPLNTILAFGELLLETELTEKQRTWVEAQQRTSWQVSRLVNDLVDVVQVDAGGVAFEAIEFDLVDLLEETARSASVRGRGKSVDFVLRVDPSVSERVVGDPSRVRQILDNLLENSVKFTDRGYVLLGANTDGSDELTIRFRVEDSGIGISHDHLASVFEPFEQDDTSIRRRFGGSGLGLAISRGLIREMGGSITVESEVGRGTTFLFALPLPGASPSASDTKPLLGAEILLVDGIHTRAAGIPALLHEWGAKLAPVDGNDSPLARLSADGNGARPPVILLDSSAREPDGALTVVRLPSDHPARLRTAVVTPLRNTLGQSGYGPELEFAAHVIMPLKRAELLNALGRVYGASLVH